MAQVASGGTRLSLDKRAMTRRTGLMLPAAMPMDAWADVGRQIAVIADASAWWLGDWLVYGQDSYPDRYQRGVERTGLSYKTLRNYAWIARRFPPSRRRDALSMQHHAEVASLDDDEQDSWLDRTELEKWPVHRLRTHLRRRRSVAGAEDEPALVLKMQITPERRRSWEKAAETAGADLIFWASQVLDQAARTNGDSPFQADPPPATRLPSPG